MAAVRDMKFVSNAQRTTLYPYELELLGFKATRLLTLVIVEELENPIVHDIDDHFMMAMFDALKLQRQDLIGRPSLYLDPISGCRTVNIVLSRAIFVPTISAIPVVFLEQTGFPSTQHLNERVDDEVQIVSIFTRKESFNVILQPFH